MNLAGNFFDEALRRSLREAAITVVPASHVDEVVDLACHAAEEALATLSRLTFGIDAGPVGISAAGIAVSLIRYRAGELEEVFRNASAAVGAPHRTVNVELAR